MILSLCTLALGIPMTKGNMNKFFVPNEVYEERLAICKECIYYSSILGQCKRCLCFMKIKARIAPMECPQGYWQKATEVIKAPDDLPQEIIDEILDIWKDLKTGRAKDVTAKKKMIELYNTIYMTNYGTGTNCGSCISTCYDGIKKLYKKYSE
jgi:NAD-dependent dihydropyrimidine dehydrogenase PreA subunit